MAGARTRKRKTQMATGTGMETSEMEAAREAEESEQSMPDVGMEEGGETTAGMSESAGERMPDGDMEGSGASGMGGGALPTKVVEEAEPPRRICATMDVHRRLLSENAEYAARRAAIENLARLVVSMTGSRSPLRYLPYEEAYPAGFEDMRRRVPCTKKLEGVLGWAPERPLEENLARIVDEVQSQPDKAAA